MAGKTVTKTKAKQKETQSTGKVSVKEAREKVVRDGIIAAKDNIETGYVDLSQLLSEAYHKEYFKDWGFNTLEEYCSSELDTNYRKAMYLIEIWDKVKGLNISKERMARLGWTKMKDLAAVITAENAKELMDRAEKMTSREVTDTVKVMRQTSPSTTPRAVTTTMKFVLGESEAAIINEALTEAQKLTGSENIAVALEMICQDWMQDRGAVPEKTLLSHHIEYLEKAYGVKISHETAKKKEVKGDAKKTDKLIDKAETKAKGRKKAGTGADDDGVGAATEPPATGKKKQSSINDLLGIGG